MANSLGNNKRTHDIDVDGFRQSMLSWYAKHQRVLLWRATKKKERNPYYTWLSEIMLQQTTVVTVGPYFEKFIDKWPSVHDLAKADRDVIMHEWAGLGYYARARNLHKCAQVVSEELNGVFPQSQKELEELPGIGGYTSAAIRAIAFGKPANVVDGNIERVMARLYAVEEPLPKSKPMLKEFAAGLADGREDKPGDYAQSLMDLGAGICTPKSPKCALCPVREYCLADKKGIAAELPKRQKKKAKPQKHGIVYWVVNDKGDLAFVRRGEKEMLGGMLGLPTSEWGDVAKKLDKPSKDFITHSFTHFDLKLHIEPLRYEKGMELPQNDYIWMSLSKLDEVGLPTLFKKVVKLMK